MLADLTYRDIVYIDNEDAIEDKYFLALANVLAGVALSDFGMQNDQALTARAIKAEQDLERIASIRPSYEILEVQAY